MPKRYLYLPVFFLLFKGSFTLLAQVTFTQSNLPIIKIDTRSQKVSDTAKITANMGITWNGSGVTNYVSDPSNNYNGKITLKYRGTSSLEFPKKSYSVTTVDDSGNDLNLSIAGFPAENDWILLAPYNDKSLIRDDLTLELYGLMGRYSPRTKFCELIIDGDYQGVYLLTEKIKRDKNRVDIAKLNPDENSGDDLTGGYILKVDRPDPGEPMWESLTYTCSDGAPAFNYLYDYPKWEDITPVQENYIQDFLYTFEYTLTGQNFNDPFFGYQSFIDVPSFVDFMLISELSKDADRYKYSVFMYKDKESKGGKLNMGPVWDSNLGYGNSEATADSFSSPRFWCYTPCYKMYWFRRLMEDPAYARSFNLRWNQLRKNLYSNSHILGMIDSLTLLLDEPQQRNFQKWPVLGLYVWPNPFIGKTYPEEIDYLKNWISKRLAWMDEQLPDTIRDISNPVIRITQASARLFPNPYSSDLWLDLPGYLTAGKLYLDVLTMTGQKVASLEIPSSQTGRSVHLTGELPILYQLPNGIYLFRLYNGKGYSQNLRIKKE